MSTWRARRTTTRARGGFDARGVRVAPRWRGPRWLAMRVAGGSCDGRRCSGRRRRWRLWGAVAAAVTTRARRVARGERRRADAAEAEGDVGAGEGVRVGGVLSMWERGWVRGRERGVREGAQRGADGGSPLPRPCAARCLRRGVGAMRGLLPRARADDCSVSVVHAVFFLLLVSCMRCCLCQAACLIGGGQDRRALWPTKATVCRTLPRNRGDVCPSPSHCHCH